MTGRWPTVPFWSIAHRVERTGHPDAQLLSVYRDWGVIRKADRDDNFNKASEDLSTYKYVEPGNLVLNKMKTWQGSLGVSPYEGIVSPAYFVCAVSDTVHGRFLHHLLRSRRYIAMYEANSKGIRTNQWDLPYEALRQIPVLMPSMEEQRRIADFLDDRVTRIDQIITARRQQADLVGATLFERARMLTTRGRSANTRATGIAWMPLIGSEFRLWRVGQAFTTGSGTTPRSDKVDYYGGQIPWATTSDLRDSLAVVPPRTVTAIAIAEHSALALHPAGTLLVAMYGATVGRAGILAVDSTVNQACCALRSRGVVSPKYAFYWLLAHRSEIMTLASGGGQPNISQDIVRSLRVPAPSWEEQSTLVATLDESAREVDHARSSLDSSVERLMEYKQSLITAAVTGEIDVTTVGSGIQG